MSHTLAVPASLQVRSLSHWGEKATEWTFSPWRKRRSSSPVEISHIRAVPSLLALAIHLPFPDIAMQCMGLPWPLSVRSLSEDLESQIEMVLSWLPITIRLPSDENNADRTASVCPLRSVVTRFSRSDQTLAVRSSLPVTDRLPS